jgi:hypothetical protein
MLTWENTMRKALLKQALIVFGIGVASSIVGGLAVELIIHTAQ